MLLLVHVSCKEQTAVREGDNKPSIFDLISHADVIDLKLSTSIDTLLANKDVETYQAAHLSFTDENTEVINLDISLSARGETRKKYCSIPPIRMKFSGPDLAARELSDLKTLKMVIPCKEDAMFDDLIFREYLCYEICRLVLGMGFRVQLARVVLEDSGGDQVHQVNYAFLIEHEDAMARRLGGVLLKYNDGKLKTIDQESYDLMVLFQYMIGNTDWNLSARHNIKLVQMEDGKAPIPIPYDFDYSGLVNAEYALPHPNLPVENIRDRFFQWRGKDESGLQEAIGKILEKKSEVIGLISEFELLSEESREDMIQYMDSFYNILEQKEPIEALLSREN